jgi:hypothetical protein
MGILGEFCILFIMEAVMTKMDIRKDLETAWKNKKADDLAYLDWFIQTRPENVPLTDEDIQAEVDAVRYGKAF